MARNPYPWQCSYCGKHATIQPEHNDQRNSVDVPLLSQGAKHAMMIEVIVCPNPECTRPQIDVGWFKTEYNQYRGNEVVGDPLNVWHLLPRSTAKPQPEYIPSAIVSDYTEACLIVNDSPKASATLSRRCLQGIIRDYWGITDRTLKREIDALQDKVAPSLWQAIDGVREIGNIGAHMDKDINVIVDVDPDEASILIELIEMLFSEWYVNRHDQEQRVAKMIALKDDKASESKPRGEFSA